VRGLGVARVAVADLRSKRLGLAPRGALPVVALLLAVWLIANVRTPDLAAQVYRADLFHRFGFAVWDGNWYSGHHLPGYSLLLPPLAALLGLRLVAVLSVLASAVLFERLALTVYGKAARWGAAWFAVAAVADVWVGRLAFALGVSFALAAVLALARGRSCLAALLAVLCAAASPVAGALLALAAVTHALARRSPHTAITLALPAVAVVVPLALLFPEGGFEPYPLMSFGATVLVVLAFVWALPAGQSTLRLGALLYLLACLLCLVVKTPMGSNVERYGVLLAGPLLLCAVLASRNAQAVGDDPAESGSLAGGDGPARSGDLAGGDGLAQGGPAGGGGMAPGLAPAARHLTPLVAVALCLSAAWVAWGPVRETLAVAGNESTSASYYAPVERFLARHAGAPVRVEVPLTRSHWEAALLAPTVLLARGWEKQLDTRFDRVLLAPGLSAEAYHRWLQGQAVSYVALPDTPLDPSSAQEGRLIRAGLPYLREVFASRHWRIFAVDAPAALASGPGRLTALGHDSFALLASSPGSFLVRVHFTPYWTVARGAACVGPAPGGWTSLTVRSAGTVGVVARFSLARALGLGGSCRTDGSA